MHTAGVPGLGPEQYFVLQQYLEAWQQPGVNRPSIYEMPADVTDILAAARIYTTSIGVANADKPLSRIEYLARKGYEQDLETIADNTIRALQNEPLFREAAQTDEFGHNELGSKLAETFSAVTGITAHNVHAIKERSAKGQKDGTVIAERMVFHVPSPDKSVDLIAALQPLLVTIKGDTCGVRPALDKDKQIIGVEVIGLNEHMARSLGRAVEALIAREDRRKYGTALPKKATLKDWREDGETFHPKVEERLVVANENYKALELRASYDGGTALRAVPINKRPNYNLLGTDGAGMLQGMRDIFNVRIVQLRGGTHRNPEQDPDKDARLRIDKGTGLKRDKAKPADVERAPLMGRRLFPHEKAEEKGRDTAARTIRDPLRSSIEVLGLIADAGVPNLALAGIKNIVLVHRGLKRAEQIDDLLCERERVQNPTYLIRRLSWLANIGGRYNLDYTGS